MNRNSRIALSLFGTVAAIVLTGFGVIWFVPGCTAAAIGAATIIILVDRL